MKFVFAALLLIPALTFYGCGSCQKEPETVETETPATETIQPETAAVADTDGRLVDVGGHRLHVQTFGSGSPTVVIEPGIGDAGQVWGSVIDELSADTRVVLYHRAGYGQSDPGPLPRSTDRVVSELDALLASTPIEPPYVVVGHSLGAVHALVYAAENPNRVAGLVLLDPPPLGFIKGERFPDLLEMAEDMTAGFRNDAEIARRAGDQKQAAFLEAVASEHESMFKSDWALVGSVTSLGNLPLVVVASGVPNPQFGDSAQPFQEYWRESSRELSYLSTRGEFVFVPESTHDLPGDATRVVVEAVRDCIEASRMDADPAYWGSDK